MTGNIYIYGEITSYQDDNAVYNGFVNPKNVLEQIQAQSDATELIVHINSYGGCVDGGFAIHDILRSSGKEITTIIEGQCYSIATVIALSGTKRFATENSEFLIHNPWTPFAGGDANRLEDIAKDLRKAENKLAEFYAKSTKITFDEVKEIMVLDEFMDLSKAIEFGFITEIKETVKAVAKFNNKNNNNKMSDLINKVEDLKNKSNPTENEKSILTKIKAFFAPEKVEVKNTIELDAEGMEIDFYEREEGSAEVGDKANIDGTDADGTYLMQSGLTYIFDNGSLIDIVEAEQEEEEMQEDEMMNELKDANAQLTETNASLTLEIETLNSKITEFENKYNAIETEYNSIKNLVSGIEIDTEIKKEEPKKEVSNNKFNKYLK